MVPKLWAQEKCPFSNCSDLIASHCIHSTKTKQSRLTVQIILVTSIEIGTLIFYLKNKYSLFWSKRPEISIRAIPENTIVYIIHSTPENISIYIIHSTPENTSIYIIHSTPENTSICIIHSTPENTSVYIYNKRVFLKIAHFTFRPVFYSFYAHWFD